MVEQPMYAAKAINNEDCIPDTVQVFSAPTSVTITGNSVLCQCDSTVLTAHSDVPGIFVWNDGTYGSNLTVAAGVYNVTIFTDDGYQMTSENFTVRSFGTDLIVSASETSICQGEHTTLYVDQDGWQGNVIYQWDADAGNSTATTVDVQPDVTTTYNVTAIVMSENGTCTAEGEVTIIVNPLPVVAAVTATETVVCEGAQTTFTATGNANTTAYIWYNNGIEVPGENQAALTVNFNEAGVYNYAVKAISNEGCVSAIALNAPVVTVNAAPESVTIGDNTVICNGGFTTLYANVVPNAPATYVWYKDNAPILGATNDNLVVTDAGSYKVVAIVNGCAMESEAVIVTVEDAPQLQLTATESIICAGGVTVITAEATGWNNAEVTYNWSNNYQGSVYTFNAAVAGTYTFRVTASQATSGCVAVDSITVNVNELPATPHVLLGNAVICNGGQVTLTVTNAVNNAVYTWYRNGVIIPSATTSVLYESPMAVDDDATNYVYTVVSTLPMSGCTSLMSANTIVTVVPTPVVTVTVEGNTALCAGGSTTLHANVTPAYANYTYQWYKDNVLISGATTADYTAAEIAREAPYNYSVVVSANPGCNVTAYAPAITFVADPVVMATISNNISCVGGTATLTAVVDGGVAGVNGLNGYTFEWYNNINPTNPVSNMSSFTTSETVSAGVYSYWVTVTSNYGCQSTSAPVAYSVIADPVVTIAVANGYPTTVCAGGSTAIKAYVTGGYGEIAYQWYKNGNLLVGETNQTLALNNLTGGANDTYTVEVTQTGVGCANNASVALNAVVTVAPTYTVDIAGFGNVCEGGTLTLNATVNNVLVGDVLSYQWYRIYNGDEAIAISGANAAQYSTSDLLLSGSYDYFVVVTSTISGCSVVSASVPANVVPSPSVAVSGAHAVCESGNLVLNAFVTGGVEGAAYTYTWNWTGAVTGTASTAFPKFVPTVSANDAAAPYYFTVTITRNDNSGCMATSAPHEVNVLVVPSVTVTADHNYVCPSGDVTFTANVSPVGTYNYIWTINGQQQAVNANAITTSLANTGTISASVVVSAANTSASCSAMATYATPVQVVAAPTVAISADHTMMCVGGTTKLTSTINANNNIPSAFNYQWAINGIVVPDAVASSFVQSLNAPGEYVYTMRVSQNNNLGCSSAWSYPVTVQVAEQPVVALNTEDGLSICEGGSITMSGVITNYSNTINGVTNSNIYGNLTFDWTSNGVNVHHYTNINNAQNQVTKMFNTIGNYDYQVSVDPVGYNCQPQASNVVVVNVVGDPSWTEVHVYGSNGVNACLGDIVTLEAEIQGGVADYSGSTSGHIQWIVTDGANTMNVIGGLGGSSYDIPAVAGTYTYIPIFVGNIGNGCYLTNTAAVQTDITVHEPLTTVFNVAACDSYTWNDVTYTQSGIYTYDYIDVNGCTGTDTLYLTVNYSTDSTLYVSVLENDLPFNFNGTSYLLSGVYTQTLTNLMGCDSVLTINLTVYPNVTSTVDSIVCVADMPFYWNGIMFTETGTESITLHSSTGADSIVVMNLYMGQTTYASIDTIMVENNLPLLLNGYSYSSSGTYQQILTNYWGCDSILTVNMNVNYNVWETFDTTVCNNFEWNGITYTQTGEYEQQFTTVYGSDSIVTLHLTVYPPDITELYVTACDSYDWNGVTYFESGDYPQTFTNAIGCDSTVMLHLIINLSDTIEFVATACHSYNWNGETYTESGDYMTYMTNSMGCDLVVVLNLTIYQPDTTDLYVTACESYVWHGFTFTQTGDYPYYATNAAGCDSIVTLHLTVIPSDHTDLTAAGCGEYVWMGSTYTTSGNYSVTYTNTAGCDSIVTLHLTINPIPEVTITGNTTICPGGSTTLTASGADTYSWSTGDNTASSTISAFGIYNVTGTSAAGCSSVASVTVLVSQLPVITITGETDICAGESTTLTANGGTTYLWNNGTTDATLTVSNAGTYQVIGYNEAGCNDMASATVNVWQPASSEFSIECPDSCYTWNDVDYCQSGEYTQTFQTVHGCDSVVTLHLTITVGLSDHDGFDFKVYPNPTSNIVNVQFTNHQSQITEIQLVDAYGRLLDVVRAKNYSPLQTTQIDFSRYATGIYFIKAVADGKTVAVRKVVRN